MGKINELIQRGKQASKDKALAMASEPYQVEILLASQPNIIRLTYKNITSSTLIAIEELDLDGRPLTYSSIKGRKFTGNVNQMLLELVPLFRIKPNCWFHNPESFLDAYYKQH